MNTFFLICALAACAAYSPAALQPALATAASTLFESIPFILAGTLIAHLAARRAAMLMALFGCGCNSGPSARSLPATLLTALLFGPWIAAARFAAAQLVASRLKTGAIAQNTSALSQLLAVLPYACVAAFIAGTGAVGALHSLPFMLALIAGALCAFLLSPCAIGAVALCASLRTVAPGAAVGFLAVAGIVDVRALRKDSCEPHHDGLAYALGALSCALAAMHHGGGMVHPLFTGPLGGSAIVFGILAVRFRTARTAKLRWAPSLMVIAALLSIPSPVYRATETSLAGAFVGERVDFTGRLTADGSHQALVRYAITCCRADAAPVIVRISKRIANAEGTWLHARGFIDVENSDYVLRLQHADVIAPPADPFVYR